MGCFWWILVQFIFFGAWVSFGPIVPISLIVIVILYYIVKSQVGGSSPNSRNWNENINEQHNDLLTYPPDWPARKEKIVNRDGRFCSTCGSSGNLHLHHVVPLGSGGTNAVENLVLLCEKCHSHKHGGRDFSDEPKYRETAFSKRVTDIRLAIESGRRITFVYQKPQDRGYRKRTIQPLELVKIDHIRDSGTTLCVRGICELRDAERNFALKRMRKLKVLDG